MDQKTAKLLNEDMEKRPAATIAQRSHFLEQLMGKLLSYSTVWRLLKSLGLGRKVSVEGMGPSLCVEGATNREVFEAYVQRMLHPSYALVSS